MISAANDKKDDRSSEDDETKIMRKGAKIMDKLEKVEKLREKTGVSYEDAKNALEACDYDLLDAIIYLEKLDKVKAPEVESFTTGAEQQTSTEFEQAQQTYTNDCNKVTFGQMMDKFFKWCGKVLKKSVDSTFIVERRGQTMINVPVLVLVIALILAFWVVLPLLVVGLFCECRYHFEGIGDINVSYILSICLPVSLSARFLRIFYSTYDTFLTALIFRRKYMSLIIWQFILQ